MVDPTFGSLSTRIGGVQIRNAAAVAKSALLEQAAERLGVKPEDLKKGPSRPQPSSGATLCPARSGC
jgi:CO/xanthine dehydrogenase Mo-binding subunit